MTDNRATERLRALLDERGVEWTDKAEEVGLTLAGFADTRWNANGVMWLYAESNGTATLASSRPVEIRGCTPEQAIAATLGGQPAKLTAEQVRKAIERNFGKVAVIDDGCEKVEWREGWVCNVGFNSQAIADDLNATLGGDGKSRWAELFGTPERAARTLSVTAKCFEPATACRECIYKGFCDTQCDYDALLGWLEGDA